MPAPVKTNLTQRRIKAHKASGPLAAHKPECAPSATSVVPTGFEHCWDRLTDEFKVFVVKAEAHGKKFVTGKATTKELLEQILATPPKLRAALMNTPGGAIYQPENFAFTETIYAALYGPHTPASSQLAAMFKVVGKSLRLDLEKHFGQVVAGMFNLAKHDENQMALRSESLKAYDDHLRLLAGVGELLKAAAPLLGPRQHIASRAGDDLFQRRLKRLYKQASDFPEMGPLDRLSIPRLKQSLLAWWDSFLGYEPRYGLADFTNPAISELLALRYGAHKTADEFRAEAVREAVRYMGLMRRKPASVKSIRLTGGRLLLTLKGGRQIELVPQNREK